MFVGGRYFLTQMLKCDPWRDDTGTTISVVGGDAAQVASFYGMFLAPVNVYCLPLYLCLSVSPSVPLSLYPLSVCISVHLCVMHVSIGPGTPPNVIPGGGGANHCYGPLNFHFTTTGRNE